ncbi:MAG: hypothetical protein QM754_06590 [Tepidisphaeraceae bacterium]
MKQALSHDRNRNVYRCDIGKPQQRFYIGSDTATALIRRAALQKLWNNHVATGGDEWTDDVLIYAKSIARGETVRIGEISDAKTRLFVGVPAHVQPMATEVDYMAMLQNEIDSLKGMIRERLGDGAVEGQTISVDEALDAYTTYRKATEIDESGEPTDNAKVEGTYCRLLARLIGTEVRLSALTYIEIDRWCKAIAARPVSLKSNKPIKLATVKHALKTLRLFIKWASRNYGWRKPDEWHEATKVNLRRTQDERIEALSRIEGHYRADEIAIIYQHARPAERLLLLMALNFGFAQAEIIRTIKHEDIAAKNIVAIRGKSETLGIWPVWDDVRALAVHKHAIPKERQSISNMWYKLLDRIQKDRPDFRRLSFKWLRKTGSSMVRQIAGGEIASLYLSHGQSSATDDSLLSVYASTNWKAVADAVNSLRRSLDLSGDVLPGQPQIARALIRQITDAWQQGLKWHEIVKLTGLSRHTVYKYRPSIECHSDD